jgi:O-succinylbenzoic acid--CoA ligase
MITIEGPSFSLTKEEVKSRVSALSLGLTKCDVREQTIGIAADLSVPGVLLTMAAVSMGLKVALCPLREPVQTIRKWLNSLGVKTLISSSDSLNFSEIVEGVFFVKDLLASSHGAKDAYENIPNQFLSIIRTSGTSGKPKSAQVSASAHWASARSVNDYFSLDESHCFSLTLPLYHVSGLSIIFRCLLSGASIFVSKNHEELVFAVKQRHVTHISLVPAQLKRLLDENVDLSTMKAVIVGGDALSFSLKNRALESKVPVYESYGLTETASMIWIKDAHIATVLPHARLHMASDEEILVGGASLFDGYIDENGALTRRSEAYFATGDMGFFSRDHDLQVVSRKSNRIISGGENIQAEEVERALEEHPEIVESVVVGHHDELFGMRPCAFVKWRSQPISHEELSAFLRERLASYKIPCLFEPWPNHAPMSLKKPRAFFMTYSTINSHDHG